MRSSGGPEVAEIFRQHGPAYRESHRLPRNELRVMRAIEVCRTAVLGGHKDQCDHCGHVEISYNSCRNRHCPKCQTLRKEKWIEARREDLLPIEYFHVVFTLPSELNPLVSMNGKVLYDLVFRSVSETLATLANNPKYLGATVGMIGILHTWGQNLMGHPHLHCIVTGGGLSSNGTWKPCRRGFFLPVRVMSALFRGKFLDLLKDSFKKDNLVFPDRLSHLKDPGNFETSRKNLYHKKWFIYCKPPFDGPKGVLQYLGRYTHRIAINNHRILSNQGGKVSFLWRDYADHNRQKIMTLKAHEFIRRFLLHVPYPLAMSEYATSACWQTENVKTTSHYVVRSSETLNPQLNQIPGKRHGRNSSSESAGSMSTSVQSVRKEKCVEWNFYCPIDATALSWGDTSYELCNNKRPGFLRKLYPLSPRPPIAKNHSPPLFPSIRRPICKDTGARNEPVSLQKD